VKTILPVENDSLSERYLGMPTDVGSFIIVTSILLRDHVWSKIKGWLEKKLSTSGKEVQVKSIAQIYTFAPAIDLR
jgi:hypothetical protein